MAERKNVNKYFPIDWDPSKGSVNQYRKQHPLRHRARNISEGSLTIRFEMPFNIWCESCKNSIGMGVRFNAEKNLIDHYYSTPIYQFTMKCSTCQNKIVIRTDPAKMTYTVIEGARRKDQRWEPESVNQIAIKETSSQNSSKLNTNAMYALEHNIEDQIKLKKQAPNIRLLIQKSDKFHKDDYESNKNLRKSLRRQKESNQMPDLGSKYNLSIELVEEHPLDAKLANLLPYKNKCKKAKNTTEHLKKKLISQKSFDILF